MKKPLRNLYPLFTGGNKTYDKTLIPGFINATLSGLVNNETINILKKTRTKKIVLISTIEVYGKENNKNEINKVNKSLNSSYGKNRVYLEEFIKNSFSDCLIIRLPIVYGNNFTKNCIYDLKNKNNLNRFIFNNLDKDPISRDLVFAKISDGKVSAIECVINILSWGGMRRSNDLKDFENGIAMMS